MMVVVLALVLSAVRASAVCASAVLALLLVLVSGLLELVLGFGAEVGARERTDDAVAAELVACCVAADAACYGAHDTALALGALCWIGGAVLLGGVWIVGV